MDKRKDMADHFVDRHWPSATLAPLAADASSRRYFRAHHPDGSTRIVMDAPPETGEDIRPFVSVAKALLDAGLSAPEIFATDTLNGFLLLEDFGDLLFPAAISKDPTVEPSIYTQACDAIFALRNVPTQGLREYTASDMVAFIAPLFDEYQARNGNDTSPEDRTRISTLLHSAIRNITPINDVIILRDFHAENLIHLPDRIGTKAVGLLDFQDAMIGHRAYDLASLLDDARREVPDEIREICIARFAQIASISKSTLEQEIAVQGAQRNMRILGIFVALAHGRSKPQYLNLLPRVWGHLMRNLAHPSLSELREAVLTSITPPNIGNLQP